MNIRLAAVAAVLLVSPAIAQQAPPRMVDLKMTVDQANIVVNAVGKLPWLESNELMQGLIAQLNAQLKPPAEAPKADAAPAAPEAPPAVGKPLRKHIPRPNAEGRPN